MTARLDSLAMPVSGQSATRLNWRHEWATWGILGLAAFNLLFWLWRETIEVWDESLYVTSAWEMLRSGHWIATTFQGTTDYYNSKPPLNVWLIALSIRTFGFQLIALRLPSVLAAWTTVAVLLRWAGGAFSRPVGQWAAVVLATSYGFLHVHSGRSANPDALLALLIVLTVVVSWTSSTEPRRLFWAGPLVGGAFLLKGAAAVMPLIILLGGEFGRMKTWRNRWPPVALGGVVGLLPCAGWAIARWRVDGAGFFQAMWRQDAVGVLLEPMDQRTGGWFFYLDVLQRHHYDILVGAVVIAALCPSVIRRTKALLWDGRTGHERAVLLAWATATLLLPTVAVTKLPWYLNPFYPFFAVLVGTVLAEGFSALAHQAPWRWRIAMLALLLALSVAESKIWWRSIRLRDLNRSPQGLLIAERRQLSGRRICRRHWAHPEALLARVSGAEPVPLPATPAEMEAVSEGDYILSATALPQGSFELIRANAFERLYRRR